jgi:amino acid permease
LAAKNGIVLAAIMVAIGGFISYFTGMLLVKCADKVGKSKYEDFAEACWGKRAAVLTGCCNIVTLLSFLVSYIVFVKSLLPQLFIEFVGEENTPTILGDGRWTGQIFWATTYTVLILFPLSLPRKAGSLEYVSLVGFFATLYLVGVLVILFFADRSLVPDMKENITNAKYFQVSYEGLISGIPFVVFAFMYQPNVPMIYRELKDQKYASMNKVVGFATILVVILYNVASTFGYFDLVDQPEGKEDLLEEKNILEVDFGNIAFTIAVCFIMLPIIASAPMCILPPKDDVEKILFKDNMSKKQNVIVTLIMLTCCYLLAVAIPSISDIITILGSTTNPMSGFILPIVFYLKLCSGEENKFKYLKIGFCWFTLVLVVVVSIVNLVMFIMDKAS